MSSKTKDKIISKEYMDSSSISTPDKHAEVLQNGSVTGDAAINKPASTGNQCSREKRRHQHNDMEKKRKEQIKACICRMGELLPATCERQSTLEIVEKSLAYMRELKEARTKFSVTEDKLKEELETLRSENEKLLDIIKAAGLSTDTIPTPNGVSSTTDVRDESPKPKSKTKKRNTLSSQIQQLHEQKEKGSSQEIISSSVNVTEDSSMNNAAGNQMMTMPPGGAFMSGQNMMFNPMMMQAGNQFMMPGMMTPSTPMMPGMGAMQMGNGAMATMSSGLGGGQVTPQGDAANVSMTDAENDAAGLLQLAMQDAGITPSSGASQPGSSAITPTIADSNHDNLDMLSQSNPLQTLASVATSAHDMSMAENAGADNQPSSGGSTGTSASSSMAATVKYGQAGYQQVVQQHQTSAANNNMMNMSLINNQNMMQGQQQQPQTQQVMFINEQGIPMIANVPVGPDMNSQQMFQQVQKQGMIAGLGGQGMVKDPSGNMEQNSMNNALALAQQQANMAALQNQLISQGSGGTLQNMAAFQQQNLINGNIIQTQNGQFIQQIGPQGMTQLQGQGQLIGMQGQGQLMIGTQQGALPVSQSGNFLTLNTMPSQVNQLPSALILPNGQIIPVVTNPHNVVSQNGQSFNQGQLSQSRMSGTQIQATVGPGLDTGQLLGSHTGSQGLLMTAVSGSTATSAGASLSTSVVPTSAIQSVMTTQIQGSSVQSQKLASSQSSAQTDVSNAGSNQPKLVGLPSGVVTSSVSGNSGLMPGGKSGATPILISLPINGQPTTVLLDPVTMQVLGTVQPQQAGATPGAVGTGVTTPQLATQPTVSQAQPGATPMTGTTSGKSKKGNANQRAICPKPISGADGTKANAPAKKKRPSKASNKNKDTAAVADSMSDSLQIQIPESTTDPEQASAISSESTDILAKAAESIFSSPLGEMGVGGFYNPANEDNPLHIDTSATEVEEETKSPSKSVNKSKCVESSISVSGSKPVQNSVLVIDSVADRGKSAIVSTSVSKSNDSQSNTSNLNIDNSTSDSVTSLSATIEEIVGLPFAVSQASTMEISHERNNSMMDMCMDTGDNATDNSKCNNSTTKKGKSKGSEKKDSSKSSKSKNSSSGGEIKLSSPKKQTVERLQASIDAEKADSDSQMDIESTLIHIPEEINFSENDISDVLSQVEQFGSVVETPPKVTASSKKAKSKRSKTEKDSDSEPLSKKRKNGKDVKSKDVLSMSSNLSVYDFDGSDDIVPSILPLNAKDFTSLSSTTSQQSMPTKAELGIPDENSKTKSSAQKQSNKSTQKVNNKSSKSNKDSDSSSKIIDNSSADTNNSTANDNKKDKDNKPMPDSNKPPVSKMPATLSMPDIDTTTSLFGFPVPKKLQRVETASRQNNSQISPKPQVSPKPSVQPVSQNSSSGQGQPLSAMSSSPNVAVSPATPVGMMSPSQNFSPEMVSPRLSIVSPSNTDLNTSGPSDSESTMGGGGGTAGSSGKQNIEMTPVKKRSQLERMDRCKGSSQSALQNMDVSPVVSEVQNHVSTPSSCAEQPSTPQSATSGVITALKPIVSPAGVDANIVNTQNSVNTQNKDSINSSCDVSNKLSMPTETSMANNVPNSSNSMMQANKTTSNSSRNFPTAISAADNYNNQQPPQQQQNMSNYKNNSNISQRPPSSMNSAPSNKFSGANTVYNSDPIYGSMNSMSNKPMTKDLNTSIASLNNFSTPFTAESMYNPQPEKMKSPNMNISTNASMIHAQKTAKGHNNAYSVDNFVQTSREDGMRMRNDGVSTQSELMPGADLVVNPTSDFSRLQSKSSPDEFNFANIGLNLQPITSSAAGSSFMDGPSVITSNPASSAFSFSLSSTATTSTATSGHHQFPYYPVLSSSSASASSTENGMPTSMPNMGMFGQNSNNIIQRNNTVMHPSGSNSNMQRGDSHLSRVDSNRVENMHNMQRNDNSQSIMPEDRDQNNTRNKPSCSKQAGKIPKGPGSVSMQEAFPYSNTNTGHEQNFFHDSQIKSAVGKSPTEQMRKDKMMDINQPQSRPGSQSSHSEKRGGNLDRSPQMMNTNGPNSYFSSNFPSAKSLNTPPLHHPSLMPQDDRSRNMTNRSPYDTPYPAPPSSQGFNSMSHNYQAGRFENTNFTRDNTGTQPLSHTPVNTGGRKSANGQGNTVKPPPKQSAPALVAMGPQQPPPRPTPPQSHRATTPIANPPGPAQTPSQVNHNRPSKQPSRNKQPSKKPKPPSFMEVDNSNLANSIFETNRSMTPFFNMQNLSPQSRAMQHEGPPFLAGNFFGSPRFPNSNTPIPKNSDITAPFNPLFPSRGAQNGLGLNFQPPGFSMNHLHGNHGNGPQITPHTASHMANLNFNNIFSDSASQNESSLNISPIKFPHTNSMLQHQGMDHNAMQHHHQYNRGHPAVMSINSILGPNPHVFESRMNTSSGVPFHSHGHPSFLNFSMHDH